MVEKKVSDKRERLLKEGSYWCDVWTKPEGNINYNIVCFGVNGRFYPIKIDPEHVDDFMKVVNAMYEHYISFRDAGEVD